jgi:putative heme-binding domain-containing protein
VTTALRRPAFSRILAAVWLLNAVVVACAEDEFALGVRTTPPLTTESELAKLHVPAGFEVQLVASEPDIHKPMNLAFDAAGRLWVTTSVEYPYPAKDGHGRDRLMIFEDFGPDGRARKVTPFADGLNIPIGVYPFRSPGSQGKDTWKAIVWSIPNIWLLEDTDGDGHADRRELLYGAFDVTRDTHGNQASFRRGFDGWLYATHGFNNDSHVRGRDGNQVDLNSGNTYRMRLDGSRMEHHTWGQVNPFGLAWDERGNLYSSDCHSAPVYQLLAGGYYPSFGKPHDGLGFAPVLMEHAHGSTAIDGMVYYTDDLWPAEYRDRVFIGNVMTSRINQDLLEFHGSSPRAIEQPDFVVADDPWFRPVDNLLGPDGALYVADFYNRIIGHYEVPLSHPGRDHDHGRIWRVVYKGNNDSLRLRPAALALNVEGLIGELASPNLNRRMLAMNDLADRFGQQVLARLELAAKKPANEAQQISLLWLLQRLESPALNSQLTTATASTSPLVRTHALRLATAELERLRLAKSSGPLPPDRRLHLHQLSAAALERLTDPDALVRRCAAETLATAPSFGHLRPLMAALSGADAADTHLVYVVRKSLRDQLLDPTTISEALSTDWNPAEVQMLADVAIAVPTAEAAALLARNLPTLAGNPHPHPSIADVLKHAARYAPETEFVALAQFARRFFSSDIEAQLGLFQSMQKGLEQRGLPLSTELKEWGQELVGQVLDQPDPSAGWRNQTLDSAPTANPWDFETRRLADGTSVRVLSSFPHGEGLTGTLQSPSFAAPATLSFWLGGHDGPPDQPAAHKNHLVLRDAASKSIVREAAPPRNDVGQKVTWNLADLAGRPVYLELTDGDTGSAYAWIDLAKPESSVIPWPAAGPRPGSEQFVTALRLARQLGLKTRAPALIALAQDEQRDADVRLAAAQSALDLDLSKSVDSLAPMLESPSTSEHFREKFGQLLAEQNSPSARQRILPALKAAPYRLQALWASSLISSHDGADAFLTAVENGQAPARILQSVGTRNRIQAANPPDGLARMDRLTRGLPPADEARDRLISERRSHFNPSTSNPVEGKRLFNVNCAPCHQIDGVGGLVGPQLTGVGNRGLDRLCEDILDPNRNVDKAFRQTLLTLKDGEVVAGLLRREEGDLIILADATGKEFPVRKPNLQERQESELSLMPDNFGEAIPAADFNHLIAYLLSQKLQR